MQTVLYTIWFLIPTFYFVMSLWSYLEKLSNKTKREKPSDFVKQGVFVLACVFLSIGVDQFFLEGIHQNVFMPFAGDWIPLEFLQIVLLPAVLLAAALLFGGSKPILIQNAPHPSKRKK